MRGSEILQRQRVLRQRTERGIRVAEGEVGGSKVITLLRTVLLGKRHRNHGIDGLNWKKDSPETSIRLSVMPWCATRIPALRAGRIRGYSNSENIDKTVVGRPYSIRNSPLLRRKGNWVEFTFAKTSGTVTSDRKKIGQ